MQFKFNSALYPDSPGVYLMKDDLGKIIYVGKAKSLKKRLSSYFQDLNSRGNINIEKIKALVESIRDIETISVNTEREALLLENELIKLHQPLYNSRLKDDKSFPFIMFTCEEQYPRIQVIRGVQLYSPKNMFFGPYTDKWSIVQILKVLRKVFPYCTCSREIPKKKCKPCLYYHLGQCPAPCTFQGDEGFRIQYLTNIKNIILFLRGNYAELLERLQVEMNVFSRTMDFERAAAVRDKITALEKMFRPQSVISPEYADMDIITLAKNDEELIILVMEIRDRRLIGKIPFVYDITSNLSSEEEVLGSFLVGYYNPDKILFPTNVLLNKSVEDIDIVRDVLEKNSGGKIQDVILAGEDLEHQNLIDIGRKNAFYLLHKRKLNRELATFDHQDALQQLADELGLEHAPSVVEGYDISNIQGKFATGSKVSFKDGKPHKSDYRRFRIVSKNTPDDFRMMAELVSRRFVRVVEGRDKAPDLIIIDGGMGQLNAALEQLEHLGLDTIPAIGLAKKQEEIYMPGESEPLVLPKDSKVLLFLQKVRDESHRFAVKYHHDLKSRELDEVEDALQEVGGIGKQRAVALRTHFKTLDAIKAATVEELSVILKSKKAAIAVHDHFLGA
ncbi:MAG TPA: excinuclease ABC subunit UvrC [Candidatus Lokiarchaeia archaeon]|nr:excinuclease ABC subunit UvrC [Candidatus Lokiarchaeia archaeon]